MKLGMKIACEIPKALIWKTRTSHSLPLFHLNTHCDDSDAALRMESCGKRGSQGRCSHSHRERHESETSDAHLLKNLSNCSRPQTSSISRPFQSVTESTDQQRWDAKDSAGSDEEMGEGSGMRGMEGLKKQINLFKRYLQLVWSLVEKVSECGRMRSNSGKGRREEKGWKRMTHGGRVSMWVIGRCRGGEGTKQGERKER